MSLLPPDPTPLSWYLFELGSSAVSRPVSPFRSFLHWDTLSLCPLFGAGPQSWVYALSRPPLAYILFTAAAAATAQPGEALFPRRSFLGTHGFSAAPLGLSVYGFNTCPSHQTRLLGLLALSHSAALPSIFCLSL